jgi:hypothetical protein
LNVFQRREELLSVLVKVCCWGKDNNFIDEGFGTDPQLETASQRSSSAKIWRTAKSEECASSALPSSLNSAPGLGSKASGDLPPDDGVLLLQEEAALPDILSTSGDH